MIGRVATTLGDGLVGQLVAPLQRQRAIRRFRTGALRRRYPESAEELARGELARARWYYSMELLPGVVMPGQYPADLPMLPRLMLRRCEVAGMSCLDVGTMEGLVPVLLKKRGARDVLAVDFSEHSVGKLAAVRHYHGVDFEFRSVGLMYRLHEQLAGRGFDLVNCSGLLYHVFSPLSVLASVRPLVKRGGLALVSTNVTLDPGYTMDFNAAGRMQSEGNTFWYPSARLLDYMLRYMRLAPIDCEFLPGPQTDGRVGYASVVCRAVDRAEDDDWMRESARTSWEYRGLSDWGRADRQPVSAIAYLGNGGGEPIDVAATIDSRPPVEVPADESDSHLLRLTAAG
jgi:2-polyprenyl-3-methyl-5-hydroxy-6-metoxy-1,4-benzoquinol methylase